MYSNSTRLLDLEHKRLSFWMYTLALHKYNIISQSHFKIWNIRGVSYLDKKKEKGTGKSTERKYFPFLKKN